MLGNQPLNHWNNVHHDKLYSSKGDWLSTDQEMSVNISSGGCLSYLFSLYNVVRLTGSVLSRAGPAALVGISIFRYSSKNGKWRVAPYSSQAYLGITLNTSRWHEISG
jgi:hypothetical protein